MVKLTNEEIQREIDKEYIGIIEDIMKFNRNMLIGMSILLFCALFMFIMALLGVITFR